MLSTSHNTAQKTEEMLRRNVYFFENKEFVKREF